MSITAAPPPRDTGVLLHGMSWAFYEHLLAELCDRPIRVTYDRGSLEIMSPSFRHERYGSVLGGLVVILGEELEISLLEGGSTTFKDGDIERGLEPDDCFWIENVERILGRDTIDLAIDPPPDLAIEIDVTRSSLDRMGIYAALRVPQVWRFDGIRLWVYVLGDNGRYRESDTSPTFPFLPLQKVAEFLRESVGKDDVTLRREFRAWIRSEILPLVKGDSPND